MVGKQFRNLTVIERAGKKGRKALWLCACKCGGTKLATTDGLNRKDNTSCGCLKSTGRIAEDLRGRVFGKLTVLKREGIAKGNSNTTWLCECKCGKQIIAQRPNLLKGQSSCGCTSKFTAIELLYKRAKYNASSKNRRNIDFTLTIEEFEHLILSNCHYCDSPPTNKFKRNKEELMYGGIDRVKNDKGYHNINCVPCCWHCNAMKLTLSYEQFLSKIKRIYNHLIQKQ